MRLDISTRYKDLWADFLEVRNFDVITIDDDSNPLNIEHYYYLFIFISLVADGPYNYHPAHGH